MAARLQMAVSLGFHIIFAAIGMAMPFLMAMAHWKWLRTKERVYFDLTKAWSKGVAIFFATGAVSGTALSFELGLLWPEFMRHGGAIIGMPFSWEGTAFFLEAIALGLFLYGWDYLKPWVHWAAGLAVGITGVASGFFVIAANAWMNSPAGFDWVNGQAINIDPWAAMFNDAMWGMGTHMAIASFQATGFAVAGLHALLLIFYPKHRMHRKAFELSMIMAVIASLIQPLSGDLSAKSVAERQPIKLAAMEALFETQERAPLLIGGIPDVENRQVNYAIEIPAALSFLAYSDLDAEVKGLEEFPESEWPPVKVVHVAFQIMVACGGFMALVALLYSWSAYRKKDWFSSSKGLALVALCTPLGFLAIEAGWTVTEVGRQPWIIYGIMKTADAVTPMPGVIGPFILFMAIYAFLTVVVTWLMLRHMRAVNQTESWEVES